MTQHILTQHRAIARPHLAALSRAELRPLQKVAALTPYILIADMTTTSIVALQTTTITDNESVGTASIPEPTSNTPSTTRAADPPYPSVPPGETAYRFRDHNGDRRYRSFTDDQATDSLDERGSNHGLSPDNTFKYAEVDASTDLAGSVIWADNHSGCQEESVQPHG